ncbi:CaiB/BaiF CoA transferase family protein [Hoeflea prorocentri]|uniref:CaiB/BaiF CoA-transferase family protein n=1 Tax=Hoeflea prorocentri TaxID=1922333 RepID=A0A9X3ZG81_9HYPH|nr:CaiB/BaiF CoA-transferase family protein [Hoeflea prorocentri]MCY6379648.1 CaiB/BaiF CoA-transferase family protein [Hoeflea prorocentri]MDA5397448.1 CaiB/BaiF CoA-transferase family protein [Hoeflea prorocentri]
MRDLESLLVITLEHAVAAPYASCKLADAGARVIKVERPEGDFARNYDQLVNGLSAYFIWINRGKESICLNLKAAEDLKLFKNMLAAADVFIQNLGPGVIERLGIDIKQVRRDNPKLIACSISGYGKEGPAKNQKAYDLLIQAESGLSAINGTEHGPARVGVSVCDIAAGMTAYQAILQALIARSRTGEGREIEVSLFHAMADWMNVPYLQFKYGDKRPTRMGLSHPTIAPYGAFECSDGKVLLLSIQNEREWASLCELVLEDKTLPTREGFDSNSARVNNREQVDRLVAEAVARRTRAQNIETLKSAGIAFGRLSEMEDVVKHPQHKFVAVETETGVVDLLAPGASVVGEEHVFAPVPKRGEHSEQIRDEFGSN